MKRTLLALVFGSLLSAFGLMAQFVPQGISYQAAALDASGQPMANKRITLRISMVSEKNGRMVHFSELHQVRTGDQGVFNLIIGEGRPVSGALTEVPFDAQQIWLDVELEGKRAQQFNLVNHSRLLSVPYAMHANTASSLVEPNGDAQEKNQSIYWLTGGNSLTSPPTQFLGTRDDKDFVIKTNDVTRIVISKEGQFRLFSGVNGADNTAASYGEGAAIFAAGSIAGTVAAIAAFVAEAAGLLAESITWGIKIREEIGVTYASGAGDYAEWLPRKEGERDLAFGEIVGVYGGRISLNTEEQPSHFLVVSRQPIILGNAPQPDEKAAFEKIAFMGQVPVKVAGPVSVGDYILPILSSTSMNCGVVAGPVSVGDYILPSGNHDGFAIAVNPDKMKIADYPRIIGVAWEAGKEDMPFNMIKTAVGINANDLAPKVEELSYKVDNIIGYLEGKEPLRSGSGFAAMSQSDSGWSAYGDALQPGGIRTHDRYRCGSDPQVLRRPENAVTQAGRIHSRPSGLAGALPGSGAGTESHAQGSSSGPAVGPGGPPDQAQKIKRRQTT